MAVLNGTEDINLLPLSPPPQGVTPNFANPSDRAYQSHIVAAVCLIIILFLASLRLYAKLYLLPIRRSDCKKTVTFSEIRANGLLRCLRLERGRSWLSPA